MKRTIFAALAVVLLPSVALAQQSGNTARSGGQKSGLTHDQIHEMQQALKDDGCYNGRVDGRMGPKTRAAIACARRKHDLEGDNANELFRALNVSFTIEDSMGMGGIMRGGNRRPERRTLRSVEDTSSNRGRAQRDSADAHAGHDMTARGDTSGMENKGKGRGNERRKPVKP